MDIFSLITGFLYSYWWAFALFFTFMCLVFYRLTLRLFFGMVIVPQDSIGVVNKKFVLFGKHKTLPDGRIIALEGEAGIQADTLAPGIHWRYWPWQFEILVQEFTTISQGKIGVVESRDGIPLPAGRVLAQKVSCDSFQDARAFLNNGGERGPQITIIPPGTYRINTELFVITEASMLEIADNMVGVVTTKEGVPLKTGEIAGKEISGHNMFQDAQVFITNGGQKGLQEQVILAGRYFINPKFATVEIKEMTTVPIANVGVVIAYVGETGVDVTGDTFKHGNLVTRGQKGVWVTSLDPGKYPINPFTHKVEIVPTANVVLNWATGKTEAHNLDKNLSTITVRSADGFKFNLDVSQIIHIPGTDAPKVIARFGCVANLVTQVLEPTIGNYFRNSAQGSGVIDFLTNRQEKQNDAKAKIAEALREYNVIAVDTLIGDIVPPEDLMKTLTDRKLAEQEQVTYKTQQMAEETRKELAQAKAMADTQPQVVAAQRKVAIAEFDAQSAVKTAEGAAKSKTINAEADANVLKMVGDAEAVKISAVGKADADVIKLKIASMDAGNYAAIKIAEALAASGNKLVPEITINGSGSGGSNADNLMSMFMANLINASIKKPDATPAPALEAPAAE